VEFFNSSIIIEFDIEFVAPKLDSWWIIKSVLIINLSLNMQRVDKITRKQLKICRCSPFCSVVKIMLVFSVWPSGFVVKASAGEKTQVIEASKMLQARREGKTSLGIFSRTTETSRSSTRTRSTSHGSIEMKMKQTKGRDFKSPLVPVKDDEWERSEGGVSRDRSVQHNRYGAV